MRASRSGSDRAAKSAPRMASPGMPTCLAIAAPVVTSSPVTMRTRMCAAGRWRPPPWTLPGRVDHPDQAGHPQLGDVGEQVTGRVEARRVQITHGGRHHPPALAFHALHLVWAARSSPASQGTPCLPPGRWRPAPSPRARALHEAPHDRPSRRVGGRVEGGHQLVGRVERQRGQPGQPLAGGVDVQAGLVAQHEQAPSVGSPTTLPSTSLASLAST